MWLVCAPEMVARCDCRNSATSERKPQIRAEQQHSRSVELDAACKLLGEFVPRLGKPQSPQSPLVVSLLQIHVAGSRIAHPTFRPVLSASSETLQAASQRFWESLLRRVSWNLSRACAAHTANPKTQRTDGILQAKDSRGMCS